MATISVSLPSDGTTADVADVNTPITTIVNEFNGNIDNANIKSAAAIDGSKLASNSVTSAQINFGGSGAGVWWQEIGRTTLGVAGDTITVSSFTAKKYLRIVAFLIDTGGTISGALRFNSDSGSNYAGRGSTNGGADGTGTSSSSIALTGTAATRHLVVCEVVNVAAQEKIVTATTASRGSAGAAAAPDRVESVAKWANTTDQVTTVAFVNGGTGDYAIGSEIVVLGHD